MPSPGGNRQREGVLKVIRRTRARAKAHFALSKHMHQAAQSLRGATAQPVALVHSENLQKFTVKFQKNFRKNQNFYRKIQKSILQEIYSSFTVKFRKISENFKKFTVSENFRNLE
jgi:hypothetical protein